jgi:hypothetical protein
MVLPSQHTEPYLRWLLRTLPRLRELRADLRSFEHRPDRRLIARDSREQQDDSAPVTVLPLEYLEHRRSP